jgi:ATP-dependent DNA helicase RecG
MNLTELNNIIAQGEGERIEFKQNFNTDAITTINGFTNTHGGVLLIGVNNRGEAIGVQIDTETIQNWINEIRNKTEPSIIPDIKEVKVGNKTIILIRV